MSLLNTLSPPKGSRKNRKRLGRGESSGLGKTSGKGHKGQKARAGGYHKVGFEGGQMPLARRLPKRGFTNLFRHDFAIVNLTDLNALPESLKEIDFAVLKAAGLVKKELAGLKILGTGELTRALIVKAKKFSKTAIDKIATAGGQAVTL